MAYLSQVGVVLAKIEATPGVDATPSSSTDFILALDAQYTPEFSVIQRNYLRPSLSGVPHLMGRQLASLTFTTEVFGTGVAAAATNTTTQAQATPKWADLLEGCAYSGATVASPAGKIYTPLTASQKTLTLYCYYDGMLHKLTGAMGTFTLNATAGELATINWTFTGVFNAPTATSTPSVTPPTVVPPLVQSCSFALGATASTVFVPQSISIDAANSVIPRADANSVQGYNSMLITARAPSISFNPEQVPEASHPFWTDYAAATAKALVFSIGGTAGNKMEIAAPNLQISGLTYADRDGIRTYEVSAMLTTTTGAGNDEVSFKFI
jgi:hypothetical protein